MATIVEETIVITLSRLTKKGSASVLTTDEFVATIEQVVQELVGDGTIVEVTKA